MTEKATFSRRALLIALAGAASFGACKGAEPARGGALPRPAPPRTAAPARRILLQNATLLDPATGSLSDGAAVLVEGDRIRDVSLRANRSASGALTIDCGGRTLMPGLIDCHVHVFSSDFRPGA